MASQNLCINCNKKIDRRSKRCSKCAALMRPLSTYRRNFTPWNKGKKGLWKHTEEWKISNSIRMTGNLHRWKGGKPKCLSCFNLLSQRNLKTGYCKSCFAKTYEGRELHGKNFNGKHNHNWKWKGGITPQDKLERTKFRQTMQKQIFERDDYTCQLCGVRGVDLQVDHIQSWAEYVELRFSMDNCRTLCAKCHYKITFGKEMPETVKGWGHNLLRRVNP